LHDLRRTFVTYVSEHGIATPHVVDAIVNHVSGSKAGVAGVYNRATYLAEKHRGVGFVGRTRGRVNRTAAPTKGHFLRAQALFPPFMGELVETRGNSCSEP
jgi:hypothetical protein